MKILLLKKKNLKSFYCLLRKYRKNHIFIRNKKYFNSLYYEKAKFNIYILLKKKKF